jgi:AcrR family transcriptional regulator
VAKRAGVGKAALYRRWTSRQALIVEMVQDIGVGVAASPDTGSLAGDLDAFLEMAIEVMSSPFAVQVLPEIHTEMARDPALQKIVSESVQKPRRTNAIAILRRAQARGELSEDLDDDFAVDIIAAPLYWRLTIARRPITPKYLRQLVAAMVAALKASTTALASA